MFPLRRQEWLSPKNIPRHTELPISNHISSVHLKKKLPELRRKFLPEEGSINDFYRTRVSSKRSSNGTNYAKDILPLGQPQSEDSLNGILHSRSYERVHCRNSFTVRVRTRQTTQEYGHIEFFFQTKPICFCLSATKCDCSVHNLALLTRLRRCVAAKVIDDKNTNASC